jgi:hypothetical protein
MKPFDLELAKKGDKVITRCGLEAKLRKDVSGNFLPIIADIYDKYCNLMFSVKCTERGEYVNGYPISDFDLFMAEDSDFQPKDNNVYYRGNMRRGDEIIADLEKRGGKNVDNRTASIRDNIYFINQFGLIDVAEYDYVKNSLDGWLELHLPPKKVKKEGWICLMRSKFTGNKYLIPAAKFYDTESIAKDCASKLEREATCLKTIKIDWEEEEK